MNAPDLINCIKIGFVVNGSFEVRMTDDVKEAINEIDEMINEKYLDPVERITLDEAIETNDWLVKDIDNIENRLIDVRMSVYDLNFIRNQIYRLYKECKRFEAFKEGMLGEKDEGEEKNERA